MVGERDWVELLNVTGKQQSLKNWGLSMVSDYNEETEIVRFPDISISANGVLLLVNMGPARTPLHAGKNVKLESTQQVQGTDNKEVILSKSEELAVKPEDSSNID